MENYRKEFNDSLGTWRDRPRHDHFSNGADAFRYLAMSLIKARTKEEDEAEYRRQLRAIYEPLNPLYDDFQVGAY